jgi:ABC-2 type transport system ATP-binding protein
MLGFITVGPSWTSIFPVPLTGFVFFQKERSMYSERTDLASKGDSILSLRSICKYYGEVRAAHNISLEIPRRCIYGFLGPNGAGKTTTIRSILNIILPDSGEVLFEGQPLIQDQRDRIGYLPEERGLYRKMKCIDQLAYFAELRNMPRRQALRQAEAWLHRLELSDWKDSKIDELSKGMQQKIQFAGTFLFEPDLVILDEPFSGLDPLNIELLREIILEERQRGITIIFSTHMLAEAEEICDAICLIDGGEKVLDGTLESVRQEYPLHVVQVAYANGQEPPADLKLITHREYQEGTWRLTLPEGSNPQELLQQLTQAGPIALFSANRPSLREIFLTAVRQRRGGGEGGDHPGSVSANPAGTAAARKRRT